MDLSTTHIHLLLNHFPTVGFIIGLAIYFVSLFGGTHHHLKQAALVILVGIAIVTIPVYVTGNAAEEALRGNPEISGQVSLKLMEMHEGAALASMIFMEITGAIAWLALWQLRRFGRVSRWTSGVVLVLGVLTLATVSRAATLGGEIRHPEIRVTEEQPAEQLGRQIGNFVRDTPWVWVTCETLHFVGLSVLIGVILLADLRVLGVIRGVPFSALDRLLPWAILAFGINVVTGMLFFAAAPGQYTKNPAFFWKVIFLMLACANTLYFTFDKTWMQSADREAPASSKVLAVTALALWFGVMYWGSMLPFIGNAF
jgi:uncharacterized membrane protein